MREVVLCGQWPLRLPEHRAAEWDRFPDCERPRLEALHAAIKTGSVVYDIGAWDGDMAALSALWGARVHLFEPSASCWPQMRAIWEANNLPQPEGCFHGFAGRETRLAGAAWTDNRWWTPAALGPLETRDSGFCNLTERPDLDAVALDDYPGDAPDIITIDVEGAEFEVLLGARWVLETARPTLFLSVHPEMMFDKFGQYQNELHTYLKGLGYTYRFLDHEHESHYVWSPA